MGRQRTSHQRLNLGSGIHLSIDDMGLFRLSLPKVMIEGGMSVWMILRISLKKVLLSKMVILTNLETLIQYGFINSEIVTGEVVLQNAKKRNWWLLSLPVSRCWFRKVGAAAWSWRGCKFGFELVMLVEFLSGVWLAGRKASVLLLRPLRCSR